MENQFLYTLLIPALPFLSFLLLALAGKKMSHRAAGIIGTSSLGVVMALAYYTAYQYFTLPRTAEGIYQALVPFNVTWLPLGTLHFDMGILLDPISVMMLIVITTVSFMVHIYSFGYMHGERGFQRYYAFLSLFTMSMLGLVIATNIFQMYLFWELVGVSSYLLIGFYYTQKAAIAASKKAFIVTRFADLFFLIGILIFGYYAKTFNFDFTIENNVREFAGAAFIFPPAMLSEISTQISEDSGARIEGLSFGIQGFFMKTSFLISIVTLPIILVMGNDVSILSAISSGVSKVEKNGIYLASLSSVFFFIISIGSL